MIDEFRILTSGIRFNNDTNKNIRSEPKESNKIESLEENPSKCEEDADLSTKEGVIQFRRQHHISVKKGYLYSRTPPPIKSFDDLLALKVPSWLVQNLKNLVNNKAPTPVQMQSIPCVLEKLSLSVSAPTGSGKTYAFAVPLLALLASPQKCGCRCLIIVPTRELSIQMLREFDLLRGSKTFRVILFHKTKSEKQRCDIGITTPLKLVQLLRDKIVNLSNMKHLVLDEADRLLDMGFSKQIHEIFSNFPVENEIQYLFYSATIPENVRQLIQTLVPFVTHISTNNQIPAAATIDQRLKFVTSESGKLTIFRQMVAAGEIKPPTLIFLQSVERAKELFRELVYDGIFVDVIHAGRSKSERDKVIQAFREKKIWILICTDLMARGIDFKGVELVISWDLPKSGVSYVHRIGRTGRCGSKGLDIPNMASIISVMRRSGANIPNWLKKMKKNKFVKISNEFRAIKRRRYLNRD